MRPALRLPTHTYKRFDIGAVKAVIVLKPDLSPNETITSELQELVKKAKGSVHAPKSIDYEESLPMTPVGKPDKKAVRARYWNETDRGVG